MSTMNATNNIFINYSKRALEITKKFRDEASIYGSASYNELKGAKADFPTFRVCVKNAPKRAFKDSLSMRDILLYVENHSGKDSKEMKELLELRGKSVKEAGNRADADEYAGFNVIKEWFFKTYSELETKNETRKNRIAEILANAGKKTADNVEAATLAASAE